MNTYENLTVSEAIEILIWQQSAIPKTFTQSVIDMIHSDEKPTMHIAPLWYENYKFYVMDNKKASIENNKDDE